jgi:hypothetical protein
MSAYINITESLANGLKNRFFEEMIQGEAITQRELIAEFSKINTNKNKSGIEKIVKILNSKYSRYTLSTYEGGSTRRPYIAFDLLTTLNENLYNTWNEKCLTGRTSLLNYEPFYFNTSWSAYNIGEHTISRIFLRTKPNLTKEVVDCLYIVKELKYIPFWASFWGLLLFSYNNERYLKQCFPVIPAPSGLFMCEFSSSSKKIEIRTFIDDKLLTDDQLASKNMLIDVSSDLLNSPLSAFSALCNSGIDSSGVLFGMLCNRISQNSSLHKLLNVIFYKIDDDIKRLQLKRLFEADLKKCITVNDFSLDQYLEKHGVKKFQSYIKQIYLSNLHLNSNKNSTS